MKRDEVEFAPLHMAVKAYDNRHHVVRQPNWPDGVRIAVNVTADFDAMLLRRLLQR